MNERDKKRMNWQLTRERFHIADRRPPSSQREERNIGTILSDILQTEPVEAPLPQVLIDRWPIVIGEQIAKHTSPARFRHGILTIYADHPGWLGEVRRLPKTHLLKKLAAIPELPETTDIRFQLDPSLRTKGFRK